METNVDGVLGMAAGLVAALGVGLVALIAFVVYMVRKREPSGTTAQADASTPAAMPATPRAPAPQAAASATVERVMIDVDGAVFGAVPPFGKLWREGDALVFEAQTRIVSATGSGIFDGDGSSTMQSMGTMETGSYRFELPCGADASTTCRADDDSFVLDVDGKTHRITPVGATRDALAAFLRAQGLV
jgi:hypothetical protein